LAFLFLLGGGIATFFLWPTGDDDDGFINIGMNISGSPYFFARQLIFNDVMKTRNHVWGTEQIWQGGFTGNIHADGYPLGFTPNRPTYLWNESAPAVLINNIYAGEYVFLYDGEGVIHFFGGVEIVSSQPGRKNLTLSESTTQRGVVIRQSNPSNHLRNFRMIPVRYANNESTMPLFRRDFLSALGGMHAIRFMDAQATNDSIQRYWQNRPRVNDWSWHRPGLGLPLEVMIDLANELGTDAWFCVPHLADDNYIREMARLIRGRLNPNLRLFIEYSNEIWHPGFAQGRWVNNPNNACTHVVTELNRIQQQYANQWNNNANHHKQAFLMARTFRIFEQEFAGTYRNRLVTVGVKTHMHLPFMQETIDFWKSTDDLPDAISITAYFNFTQVDHDRWMQNPSTVTANDVLQAIFDGWDYYVESQTNMANLINASGAKLIVYEGGQHMQPWNQQVWPYNQAVWDAQIHPRMHELYMKNFKLHKKLGVDLFMHFAFVGTRESRYGSWGALENVGDYNAPNMMQVAPKWHAIIQANNRLSR